MRNLLTISAAALLLLPLCFGAAYAEGFGTPAMDGQVDGVYNTAEATDGTGDGNGNANMDLIDLYVCNDNNFWYFLFTVNANVNTTNWGKYILYLDTTGDTDGATADAWGRSVTVTDPHKPEFGLYSWVDNLPYGDGNDSQFWEWDQGTTSWSQNGTIDGLALDANAVSGIEWKISRSKIGNPDSLWCEVWCTGGGGSDPAQDTSNDPAEDWNAVDWSTPAVILNSTKVIVSSGGDTTPPVVENGRLDDGATDSFILTFSEPLDPTTAENSANYTITGAGVTTAALYGDSTEVLLTLDTDLAFGSCLTAEAVNVEDLSSNPIVDNNTTNVFDFYLTELTFNAQMRLYLRTNSAAPDPDTVAIEGGIAPLTFDPTCDDLMAGPDADSVYTGTYVFLHTCTEGVTDTIGLEYKFTHQCVTWEPMPGNHYYQLDGTLDRDTLTIWWSDEAPFDFTDKDIDVILQVRSNTKYQWDRTVDSIGVNGNSLPLTWEDSSSVNLLDDNGVLPDSTADDGIFTTRITFPTGTKKSVEFKYLWQGLNDTLFNYECFLQGNRDVYLNDTLFSTTAPIVLDLAFWDICGDPTGVEESTPLPAPARFELLNNVPNPFNPTTAIEFNLPERNVVNLSIYDISGRVVRTLLSGELVAGFYTGSQAIVWNGKDDSGNNVSSGVYFYRLRADGEDQTRKMVLVR